MCTPLVHEVNLHICLADCSLGATLVAKLSAIFLPGLAVFVWTLWPTDCLWLRLNWCLWHVGCVYFALHLAGYHLNPDCTGSVGRMV